MHLLTYPLPLRQHVTLPDGSYYTQPWRNDELHRAIMAGGKPDYRMDGNLAFAQECVRYRDEIARYAK